MKINELDLEQLMYIRDTAEDQRCMALQAETELYITLILMAGTKRYHNYMYVGD